MKSDKPKSVCACGKEITEEESLEMEKEWKEYLAAHPELKEKHDK